MSIKCDTQELSSHFQEKVPVNFWWFLPLSIILFKKGDFKTSNYVKIKPYESS